MLKKQKPPQRSDFPPDAKVHPSNREENSAAMLLFSVFLLAFLQTGCYNPSYIIVHGSDGV